MRKFNFIIFLSVFLTAIIRASTSLKSLSTINMSANSVASELTVVSSFPSKPLASIKTDSYGKSKIAGSSILNQWSNDPVTMNRLPMEMSGIKLPHMFSDHEMLAITQRLRSFSLELSLYTALLANKNRSQRQALDTSTTWPIIQAIIAAEDETCKSG